LLLYRVFPYQEGGDPHQPGGTLYMPLQGNGRADNPDHYSVFYAGDSEAGAIAEAFGRFPEWTESMLTASLSLPGSHRALATFSLPAATSICNLDDPAQLIELSLRPSQVVTRDYRTSQDWALEIFERQRWNGVKWWSYYDPRWYSYALWDYADLAPSSIRPIYLNDPALAEAADVLTRRIVSPVRTKPRAV
jgi:hypothetical protein